MTGLIILGAVIVGLTAMSLVGGTNPNNQYGGKSSSRKHRRGKSSNNKTSHR